MISRLQHEDDYDERIRERIERQAEEVSTPSPEHVRKYDTFNACDPKNWQKKSRRRSKRAFATWGGR